MSQAYFDKVRDYLQELEVEIAEEDHGESLFVVNDEARGLNNLIVDCEDELLVIEQVIMKLETADAAVYKRLLQMNRELVHGAFVLDDAGTLVLFRDTLQLANLDLNELDASINALGLGLASFAGELVEFAKAGG